ncbi:MAG: ATP-dependent helicase, partial [Nitrospinota bacterium]
AINHLIAPEILQAEFYDQEQQIELTASADLKHRLKNILPGEAWPDDDVFVFSTDKEVIQKEIKESRKEEMAWPKIQYLWSQNPVLEWVNDKAVAAFSRHEAKVMTIHDALERDEVVFLLSGVIPNRKSHPLIHRWFGVTFQGNLFSKIEPLIELLDRTGLGKKEFPNRGTEVDREGLKKLLPQAVSEGKNYLLRERKTYEYQIDEKLNQHLKGLERLRGKQHEQLELFPCDKRSLSKKDERRREIDTIFDEFLKWTEDTMTTEANPYIQVAAVLRGSL